MNAKHTCTHIHTHVCFEVIYMFTCVFVRVCVLQIGYKWLKSHSKSMQTWKRKQPGVEVTREDQVKKNKRIYQNTHFQKKKKATITCKTLCADYQKRWVSLKRGFRGRRDAEVDKYASRGSLIIRYRTSWGNELLLPWRGSRGPESSCSIEVCWRL